MPEEPFEPPDPQRLEAYFALSEATSLLQHQVERHLRAEADLGAVQFQLLMRLAFGAGQATMTELADGVVYSRSGLTYQVKLLDERGLVTRAPSPDDDRATLVSITDAGRALIDRVLPGHVGVVRELLLDLLTDAEAAQLGELMGRVRDRIRTEPPRSARPRKPRG